jgi:hypothetical protein
LNQSKPSARTRPKEGAGNPAQGQWHSTRLHNKVSIVRCLKPFLDVPVQSVCKPQQLIPRITEFEFVCFPVSVKQAKKIRPECFGIAANLQTEDRN